ncbi:MAG: hypothetical protein Kow001_23450 [Acidobacteriota bacterium]
MRYTSGFSEDRTLRDGTRVRIRTLRPEDRRKILEGFGRLSFHSRYLRFLTPKSHLTDEELKYLAELDSGRHFGLVVVKLEADGSEGDGVGIARFVLCDGDPRVAEPAVTVTDEMQGRGLGRLLLQRLADAAVERGVDRFRCFVLSENLRVQDLIRRVFPGVHFQVRGEMVTAEFPVREHV